MTTSTITVLPQSQERQPSQALTMAIKECASGFRKLQDSIQQALKIGRSEGYKDLEIGSMIRQEMLANNYSLRSVQRYLPAGMKRSGGYNQNQRNDNLSFQIQPSNYNSEDLPKYSKQFLIEIIQYLERKYDIPKPKPITNIPIDRASNDKERQIIELHNQGKSSRAIAATIGIGKSSVQRILTRK